MQQNLQQLETPKVADIKPQEAHFATIRSRSYVFTVNNYTTEMLVFMQNFGKTKPVEYMCFSREVGESGTPHLQGMVMFKNGRAWKSVQASIPGHIEYMKGTPQQAMEYCMKDNAIDQGRFWESDINNRPKGQGARTDLEVMKEGVKSGWDIAQVWENAQSYQAFQMGKAGVLLRGSRRDPEHPPLVIWCHGPTGSGKSKWAWSEYPDAWGSGQVVNGFICAGYNGQDVAIFDDLRPQDVTFSLMLKLLDRYPMRVRVIGGDVNWAPKVIVITTPNPPEAFYAEREDIGQLLRRITVVRAFGDVSTQVGGNSIAPPTAFGPNFVPITQNAVRTRNIILQNRSGQRYTMNDVPAPHWNGNSNANSNN